MKITAHRAVVLLLSPLWVGGAVQAIRYYRRNPNG